MISAQPAPAIREDAKWRNGWFAGAMKYCSELTGFSAGCFLTTNQFFETLHSCAFFEKAWLKSIAELNIASHKILYFQFECLLVDCLLYTLFSRIENLYEVSRGAAVLVKLLRNC